MTTWNSTPPNSEELKEPRFTDSKKKETEKYGNMNTKKSSKAFNCKKLQPKKGDDEIWVSSEDGAPGAEHDRQVEQHGEQQDGAGLVRGCDRYINIAQQGCEPESDLHR